jgi:hypothetical protein
MDIENINERITDIKERAIDNVDLHFNQYILDELINLRDSEYFLIDSVNWAIYWTDILADLKPLMDEIIIEFEKSKTGELIHEALTDCIELKKLIDSKIMAYELEILKEEQVDIYEIYKYAGVKVDKPRLPSHIRFTKSQVVLKELHKGLKRTFGYIDDSNPDFCLHFNDTKRKFKKIRWNADDQDLAMLILLLVKHELIAKIYTRRINQVYLIKNHFLNQDGELFKESSLRTLLRRMEKLIDSNLYDDISIFINNLTQ